MSGLKLTTTIDQRIAPNKMMSPNFTRALGFPNELFSAQVAPRVMTTLHIQPATLWEEITHLGFDRFYSIKKIFVRGVVRIATEIYSGGDDRIIVEIHLYGKGRDNELGFVYLVLMLLSGDMITMVIKDRALEPLAA